MATFPRVEPHSDIKCGKDCEAVFYEAPGPVRPFVIACQNRKCGHKGFVRSNSQDETEALWRTHLEPVEA